MSSSLSLTFLGAAGTVTGSKHLLEVDGHRVLIDCGLFQGLKALRLRNWEPFPIDPASIDAVILTHAHLDHCGDLPRLVAAGFRGRIFCTPGTKDLCSLVLPDAAHIQEEDARQANRHGYTKHAPALPLFTSADAARALTHLQPVGYNRPIPVWGPTGVGPGSDPAAKTATVEFINAGHLLGSAYARVRVGERTILFGGDLGRYGRPILPDPSPVDAADVLLLESTYGDRVHEVDDNGDRLAAIVNDTASRGGRLIIPSFAIGRVEEIVYWLKRLEEEKRIPVLPVFIDSPMAAAALTFYSSRMNELDPQLTPGQRHVCAFCTTRMVTVSSPQQSKDLTASRQPAIVISSSGMATGGRVLHHLEAGITSAKNTVLFVGYQAAGTRGRTLVDGGTEIKLHGRILPVAARIERIDSMSAHADAAEIMRWLSGFSRPPRMTHLVHGEPTALAALSTRITKERGWPVHIAAHHERVDLP
ncbi:MAG: MBL fold metallo-hydrolase [Acidobacteriia bacterium]|nr:MBL fold metallo-hydrolase [Terriglobia bacterium]